MALQDILDKLVKETEIRLKDIEKSFNEKKKKLDKETDKEEKNFADDMQNRVEEKKKMIIGKAETLAERESKNKLLGCKRNLIDKIFILAIDELSKDEKYEKILTEILERIDIKDENIVIVPARGKEEATKKAIKAADKKFFLSEKSADIKGGFILKTERVEIDNSFETIIGHQMREDLEIKLNKLLF